MSLSGPSGKRSRTQFRIRDKKAFLTDIYIKSLHEEYREFMFDYPSPGRLWQVLRKEIRGIQPTNNERAPVIMDLAQSADQEWNFPVFRYKVEYEGSSPNIEGRMWFYYTLDTEASYADDTDPHWEIAGPYSFSSVAMDSSDGEPVANSGIWTVTSMPPARVWRPKSIGRACIDSGEDSLTCMSENPHLMKEYLQVILGDCASNNIFVDSNPITNGTGSLVNPFKTIEEGVSEVCEGGTLYITEGRYRGPITFSKRMRLVNAGGAARITWD